MADELTHEACLARIVEVERDLVEARARAGRDKRERDELTRRVRGLANHVKGLERRAKRRGRRAGSPVVKNVVAAILTLIGLFAALTGGTLQVRLLLRKVHWVETTCAVTSYDDDGTLAIPSLPHAGRFAVSSDLPLGSRIPCFVPDRPLIEALGRTTPPPEGEISAREKIRKTYMLLMIEGLAAIAFLSWISIRKPAEDA